MVPDHDIVESIRLMVDELKKEEGVDPMFVEYVADTFLENFASRKMNEQLKAKREKGKHGWWDEDVCTMGFLNVKLKDAVESRRYVDAMIYAAMLEARRTHFEAELRKRSGA